MRQLSQCLGHLEQLQKQREASCRRAPHDFYDTPTTADPHPVPPDRSDDELAAGLPLPIAMERGGGWGCPFEPYLASATPDCTHPDHHSLDRRRG